ncbi:hypothetical protein F1331_24110 [Salmonella enterica subsp. enterica serovar Dessau]|uniref:Uncharacterized protein n=1 Tax=Salmonella enterica subsp. enterica serovar Dessau TaxID=2564349 RepID=A0A8E5IMJ7_SALET|nr:hypothetical protein F1331_24110 [Salmonella enterica subsp. enterica serovar Dessau]
MMGWLRRTYVDYKINLLDEDDDFYANSGIATDDIVGVGLVYQFSDALCYSSRGDHGQACPRIVRHVLDQAGSDRRQRHAAARRRRARRSRRHPDQGRF